VMFAPVPCLPDPAGSLQIGSMAELGLLYGESAVVEPQPGYNFICLLQPQPAWHPNISSVETGQRICLGTQLPAGTRVREILFLTYQALILAAAQFDPLDPGGVMNRDAAEWLQHRPEVIPLSKEGFLATARNAPADATE